MSKSFRLIQWIAALVLLLYLVVLTKNIVFKKDSVRYYKQYFARDYKRYSVSKGWRKANTIPFRTINLYYRGYQHNNSNATYNLLGNLLGFIPFGILLPLAISWFRPAIRMFVAIIVLCLGFEMLQLYTGLGIFDVDDLILNTVGAVIGYLCFFLFNWLQRRFF